MEEQKEATTVESKSEYSGQNTWGSKIIPIFLVFLGVYFLLREYRLLDNTLVKNIIKLWPLIFVYIGLDRLTISKPRLRPVVLIILVSLAVFFILMQSDGYFPYIK